MSIEGALDHQEPAIQAVVESFRDPGQTRPQESQALAAIRDQGDNLPGGLLDTDIYVNPPLPDREVILRNIQRIQADNHLPISPCLSKEEELGDAVCLDVEMETGTGKTYVYLRTMVDLYHAYGWDHFILSVPTVAIRQGVLASLRDTKEHFYRDCNSARIQVFAYSAEQNVTVTKAFCGKPRPGEIHLLLVNIQKYNKLKDKKNIIHLPHERLGGLSASECIAKTRPVVILDEPQNQGGDETLAGLGIFAPQVVLHYSATHAKHHELVYRLGAGAALEQNLVKRIVVLPLETRQEVSFSGVPYVRNCSVKKGKSYTLRVEILCRSKVDAQFPKQYVITPELGEDLKQYAGFLPSYDGVTIRSINTQTGEIIVSFSGSAANFGMGEQPLKVGEAIGQGGVDDLRRLQLMAAVKRHLDTEKTNFRASSKIKTLTLFFIDRVERYTGSADTKARDGDYARWLQEIYKEACKDYLSTLPDEKDKDYRLYLERTIASDEAIRSIHGGYFSSDPKLKEDAESEVVADYDVILNDKAALLRIDEENVTGKEAIRFIFSHSALREGWDNPNVFTLCYLKEGTRKEGRLRQEIGRGLRICVDQKGQRRQDEDRNKLGVVTTADYKDFIAELQSNDECSSKKLLELLNALRVTSDGKTLAQVNRNAAKGVLKYLKVCGFMENDRLTETFRDRYKAETLPMPSSREAWAPYSKTIFAELAAIDAAPTPENGTKEEEERLSMDRRDPLDDDPRENARKEALFKAMAERVFIKVRYELLFTDEEVAQIAYDDFFERWESLLPKDRVTATVKAYEQDKENPLKFGEARFVDTYTVARSKSSQGSRFNLVQDVMDRTGLSRACVCMFLKRVWGLTKARERIVYDYDAFVQALAICLNKACLKAVMKPEAIKYIKTVSPEVNLIWTPDEKHSIKTLWQGVNAKHCYTILPIDTIDNPDGGTEGRFVTHAEQSNAVMLYAKIPDGVKFPTPIGDYTPDWIVILRFEGNTMRFHKFFFVCETKGKSDPKWRGEEITATLDEVQRGKIMYMGELAKLFIEGQDDAKLPGGVHYTVLNANNGTGGISELLEKAQEV